MQICINKFRLVQKSLLQIPQVNRITFKQDISTFSVNHSSSYSSNNGLDTLQAGIYPDTQCSVGFKYLDCSGVEVMLFTAPPNYARSW